MILVHGFPGALLTGKVINIYYRTTDDILICIYRSNRLAAVDVKTHLNRTIGGTIAILLADIQQKITVNDLLISILSLAKPTVGNRH